MKDYNLIGGTIAYAALQEPARQAGLLVTDATTRLGEGLIDVACDPPDLNFRDLRMIEPINYGQNFYDEEIRRINTALDGDEGLEILTNLVEFADTIDRIAYNDVLFNEKYSGAQQVENGEWEEYFEFLLQRTGEGLAISIFEYAQYIDSLALYANTTGANGALDVNPVKSTKEQIMDSGLTDFQSMYFETLGYSESDVISHVEKMDTTSFDFGLTGAPIPAVLRFYARVLRGEEPNLESVYSGFFPGGLDVQPEVSFPSAPSNFRYEIYSNSAVELFWERSTDDSRVVGYDVFRNGDLVETRDATSYFDDSLNPGTTYTFDLVAVDDEGNRSVPQSVSFTTIHSDNNLGAPTSPLSYRFELYSRTAAELFWERSTDDSRVVGYDVFRNGDLVETRDATSYFDDSLNPGTTYTFELVAVDDEGNRSVPQSVSFTTIHSDNNLGAPTSPLGYRFELYSRTAAELFWERSTDDSRVVGYDVFRNGDLVETRDATSYFDDSLNPGTTYTFDLVAVDDEGNRSVPQSVSFTTIHSDNNLGAPTSPLGYRFELYSRTAAELFWERSTDDSRVVGYDVFRNGDLVETRDATSYFDDSLNPGTTYTFDLVAVDDEGNRSASQSVSFTP